MILAGIDEAGLGPTLGPLVTACAALEVPDDWRPESPWERLADACSERFSARDKRPAVADSKVLHRAGGLAALELTVGAFSLLAGPGGAPELAFPDDDDGGSHPCYSRTLAPFPAVNAPEDVRRAAEALSRCLERAGAKFLRLRALALHEPVMNRRFDRGLNKNQVLLRETGAHIRSLAAAHAGSPLLLVVDKQGGRDSYLPFLTDLFPGAWIDVLEECRACSRYRLRRTGGDAEIRFQARADSVSFPTALASLAAKHARERAMAELNAWFGGRLPSLRPTAGYPADAGRWLADTERDAAELRVGLVVRKR